MREQAVIKVINVEVQNVSSGLFQNSHLIFVLPNIKVSELSTTRWRDMTLVFMPVAPPKILALAVEGSEQSGFRAVCQVQGSPLPDVQWLSNVEPLEVVGPVDQGPESNYQTVSQLSNVAPGQQYTCSTSNPLGRDQSTLYMVDAQTQLSEPGAPPSVLLLVFVSLGAKFLLLLGTLVLIVQGVQQKING